MTTKKPDFKRRNTTQYSRLGRGRKKLVKWRRPKGRHGQMRLGRRGYAPCVEIGYKQTDSERGKLNEKKIVQVSNMKELVNVKKDEIVMLGRIGKKMKIEIAKKANEMKIEIANFNAPKFLKQIEKEKTLKSSKNEAAKTSGNKK
jgi:ribosomal protein L32E